MLTHDDTGVDEFIWLEDIAGEQPLAWVAEQNARTHQMLATPSFERTEQRILEVLDSDDRIPMVAKNGEFYYNFWRDAAHPRGLWRRTTLASYRTNEPDWEILLDLDELGQRENTGWVWAGAELLYPDYRRALLELSPDGGDAVAIREFDLETREFVADGFILPTAKTSVAWIDLDTIFIATDFGPGSMTTSSYPRQVKRWKRGTTIESAELIFEVPVEHMVVHAIHDHTKEYERDFVADVIDFYHSKVYLLDGDALTHIDVPDDANVDLHREWLLIRPRSDWTPAEVTYPAGSLLAAKIDAYLKGSRELVALFTPDERTALSSSSWTRHHLLLTLLHDVSSRIEVLTPGDGEWARESLAAAPALHSVNVSSRRCG